MHTIQNKIGKYADNLFRILTIFFTKIKGLWEYFWISGQIIE